MDPSCSASESLDPLRTAAGASGTGPRQGGSAMVSAPSTADAGASVPPSALQCWLRRLWLGLPLLVGVGGLVATLVVWQTLVRQEHRHLQEIAAVVTTNVRHEVVAHLEARVRPLVRMVREWEQWGQPPEEAWAFRVGFNLEHFPGYQALGWVDPSWRLRWLAPVAGNEAALGLDAAAEPRRRVALEAARDQRAITATRPFPLAQGGMGFAVYVPLFAREGFAGVLSAVFRPQAVFVSLVRDLMPGYGFALLLEEEELYQHVPVASPERARWQHEQTFTLYGVPWRLQVWPLPAVLAQERTVLPAVVLGGGSFLTVLLALVLGLVQRTRRLNQELDQRVQARTAALAVAEAAERVQRERWQTTLASIGDAVIVTDTAGRVNFLNAVAQTLTGWAPDEATGQPLPQIFRIVNEVTRRPVENPLTRVIREGVIVGLANHTLLIAKDSRETPIDDSGAPIRDAQGQISGAVLVFRDITARKQVETAQHCLAEVSALLASALDLPTQLTQLARLLVPTLADWCSIDLLHDDERIHRHTVVHADPAKAALAEQLRRQYPTLATEAQHTLARVLRTGQSWFDPAVSAERLRAEARDKAHWDLEQALGFQAEMVVPLLARGQALGTITCVLGEGTRRYSAADLALAEELARRAAVAIENARLYHAAQAAQEALQRANADLERRVEERTAALHHAMAERQRLEREALQAEHFALLGRLAAGVSHEIRNPLGAVFLHVDLLAEELAQPSPDSSETIAEALAEIRTNLARVEDLVQDYLALVRVSTLQRDVQDLGAAVQAWETEFQQQPMARGVTFQLNGVATLGLVAFHTNTLHRALLNLVHNALEAMPQGGTLTLAGHSRPDQVQIEVRDTGSGIAAERLTQIFEPLYTTKPGGTGLGLYIVQEILRAHGGQVTVASQPGQGTTFTLTLPRAAATLQLADAAPTPAAEMQARQSS